MMPAKLCSLAVSMMVLALAACGKVAGTTGAPDAPAQPAPSVTPITVNDGEPVDGDVTLTVPASAVAGAYIKPVFSGPANARDYIDLVPRGYTRTSGELSYIYVSAAVRGDALRLVTTPGEYDVRYILDLRSGRKVKAVQPLTVTAAEATLESPATAQGGELIRVAWTGPAGQGDYIDIVPAGHTAASGEITYAYTSAGSPASLKAPGAAGDYQIRYILEGRGGRKVLAASALAVTEVPAKLIAPDSAARGATVIVEYQGPNRSGDYIDLVRKGYLPASGELAYFYVGPDIANELKMPAEAGDYEIRYVMEAPDGRRILARRPIRVE